MGNIESPSSNYRHLSARTLGRPILGRDETDCVTLTHFVQRKVDSPVTVGVGLGKRHSLPVSARKSKIEANGWLGL